MAPQSIIIVELASILESPVGWWGLAAFLPEATIVSKDIDSEWFKNCKTVGISAGASTPDYLIEKVKDRIMSF